MEVTTYIINICLYILFVHALYAMGTSSLLLLNRGRLSPILTPC